jgi:acetyl-CoA carboxylase biotin carboxylase subunit
MGQAAMAAATAVGYRGAGTCEFLLGADGSFYFLEMNTRIQVEHPVTELVYAVDLVREQLRIARGLGMSVSEWPLHPRGHAIECRITAEDPENGFLPATGRISYLHVPAGPGVRWDAGIQPGDEIGLHYDSLLAKLIVHAENRAGAIRRMRRAIEELVIVGVATNQGFLRRLLADPDFAQGEVDIGFLERRSDLLGPEPDSDATIASVAAAVLAAHQGAAPASKRPTAGGPAAGAPERWLAQSRLDALR